MTDRMWESVFTDETGFFSYPQEPSLNDSVTIRVRVAKDCPVAVYLLREKTEYKLKKVDGVCNTVGTEKKGPKLLAEELFAYYECTLRADEEDVAYLIRITHGAEERYFSRIGLEDGRNPENAFHIMTEFQVPDWARGAVMYQIYVDRFFDGDSANDVLTNEYAYIERHSEKVDDWEELPHKFDVHRFYGGDLAGVQQKLDYLQQLGVEVIYFNPLFVSPSNHKYDIQDFDYIDPHYGVIVKDEGELLAPDEMDNTKATRYICRVTSRENLEASNAFFSRLVEEIHSRGMRVILDGVFNHCGSFNKWMDRERIYEKQEGYFKGAYVSKDSPYHDYFVFHGDNWPYNGAYNGWWGHDTLPELNYEASHTLYEDILRIGAKWVSPPFCADGWRLDVAADLGETIEFNHKFWQDFRRVVKAANPSAIILAEHYGNPSSWLQGNEWDTVMNYDAFMEPVTWFLTGMEKHSDKYNPGLKGNGYAFFEAMRQNMKKFHMPSLQTAMNELSNHDHSRFLTRTNTTVGRVGTRGSDAAGRGVKKSLFKAAVLIQMSWPGSPTIYYGDEVGMVGWTDPDNRRTFPWGREDLELLEFHKYMVGIHKSVDALKYGSVIPLLMGEHFIAYGRFEADSQAVVIVNEGDAEIELDVPVWMAGISDGPEAVTRVMITWEEGFNVGKTRKPVEGGLLHVKCRPRTARLYVAGETRVH